MGGHGSYQVHEDFSGIAKRLFQRGFRIASGNLGQRRGQRVYQFVDPRDRLVERKLVQISLDRLQRSVSCAGETSRAAPSLAGFGTTGRNSSAASEIRRQIAEQSGVLPLRGF